MDYRISKYFILLFLLINLADAAQVLKPYISYIISYVENICNTSNDQEITQLAR
jgi:hypothetical protein